MNVVTTSDRMNRDFIGGVLNELLENTRLGWATKSRSEWMYTMGGVYDVGYL